METRGGRVHHAYGRCAPYIRNGCTIHAVPMHHHPRSCYSLGAAYADHWETHGEQQVFRLIREHGMQRIRHTQKFPPHENVVEFPCPDAVDAVIVVRISKTETVMMLAAEESNGHN